MVSTNLRIQAQKTLDGLFKEVKGASTRLNLLVQGGTGYPAFGEWTSAAVSLQAMLRRWLTHIPRADPAAHLCVVVRSYAPSMLPVSGRQDYAPSGLKIRGRGSVRAILCRLAIAQLLQWKNGSRCSPNGLGGHQFSSCTFTRRLRTQRGMRNARSHQRGSPSYCIRRGLRYPGTKRC